MSVVETAPAPAAKRTRRTPLQMFLDQKDSHAVEIASITAKIEKLENDLVAATKKHDDFIDNAKTALGLV